MWRQWRQQRQQRCYCVRVQKVGRLMVSSSTIGFTQFRTSNSGQQSSYLSCSKAIQWCMVVVMVTLMKKEWQHFQITRYSYRRKTVYDQYRCKRHNHRRFHSFRYYYRSVTITIQSLSLSLLLLLEFIQRQWENEVYMKYKGMIGTQTVPYQWP